MTKRERVLRSIRHQDSGLIPYSIGFTWQEHEKLVRYTGDPHFEGKIQNHLDSVYFDGFLKEVPDRPGYFTDDFGVCWNRNGTDKDIGVIDGLVLPEPSMNGCEMPAVRQDALNALYRDMMQNGKNTFKHGNIGFSMFERAWTLRGMENFLTDMLLEPSFAEELLDTICDFNLRIMDLALAYDIDGFMFGDDWGQQRGLIMGPELWRKFIKPRMARMYERAKSKGKYILQHSCGDIHELFPDLIEIGLDVYQTFQPEIYDIEAVKREFGKDLTFWGGISTQTLLPVASPEQVRSETIRIMRILGKNGGYIAAPTHAIPGDVPPENVLAMLDVMENQEKYL